MTESTSYSIVIPTCKLNVDPQIQLIKQYTPPEIQVSATCQPGSAAQNRNRAIDIASTNYIVMVDDDVYPTSKGWAALLVYPLMRWPERYSIVSASLFHEDGRKAPQLGDCNGKRFEDNLGFFEAVHTEETMLNISCSACWAFRKSDGIRFNEKYHGATYEDSDFCMQMNKKFPERKIIINDLVEVVHKMESKGRGSSNGKRDIWAHNRDLFEKKWGVRI